MIPSLPHNDSLALADARRLRLDKDRGDYLYDYSYENILYCKDVPVGDKSDPRYWIGLAKMNVEASANKAKAVHPLAAWIHELLDKKPSASSMSSPEDYERLQKSLSSPDKANKEALAAHPVASLAVYAEQYPRLPKPLPMDAWARDDVYSWQAIAGCNPTMIRRLTEPLAKFPVTEADYARALGVVGHGEPDSLSRAMAEGRVYIVDYVHLDGMTGGTTDGLKKYIWAPIAMHVWQPARHGKPGGLMPVAIQCGQTPGPAYPIYTPADGPSWKMARVTVAVANSQVQGLVVHFGLCHLVMEAVTIAMKRQLAPLHPLRVLLEPHVEFTLITNEICRKSLTNAGGIVDRLQAMTLPVQMKLVVDSIARFRLLASSPPEDIAARGVGDTSMLPVYPWRDDQLLVWGAVEAWVEGYVRLYYQHDADVINDIEMQAFVAELGADEGGRLQGIPAPATVKDVVDLMARIVFRASAFHATVNYSLYDFTYAPNGPTSGFAAGPTTPETDTEAAFVAMYPPTELAYEVIAIYYPLLLRLNRLGDYGGAFSDERVTPMLKQFQSRLREIDTVIDARNKDRLLPYEYSKPALITNSIHV